MFWLASPPTPQPVARPVPNSRVGDAGRRLDGIRAQMTAALEPVGDAGAATLARRIRHADAGCLWYLRSDLMQVLAARHGEAQARERLAPITGAFQDLLPQGIAAGLAPRPPRCGPGSRY